MCKVYSFLGMLINNFALFFSKNIYKSFKSSVLRVFSSLRVYITAKLFVHKYKSIIASSKETNANENQQEVIL